MKLSLATRIFLGYAAVLVTFGAVSLFSVAEMHRNQQEIRLVSQGYLRLGQDAANLEVLNRTEQQEAKRVHEEQSAETRKAFIRLARYTAPSFKAQARQAREDVGQIFNAVTGPDRAFVLDLMSRFDDIILRNQTSSAAAQDFWEALQKPGGSPEAAEAAFTQYLNALAAEAQNLSAVRVLLEHRVRDRVDQAERRERRTGIAIITLSLLAILVGLVATAWSARALRPVRTLIEGVSRIGRGDYSARLGLRGEDEISVLAGEFDQMARSLREREAQLKEKQEALLRAEQLAAVGRISAQVAHEVRNPLSSIGLNVELLEEAFERAAFESPAAAREAKDVLAAVMREVDRLTEVTDQYLRMARLPSPELLPEDLNAVVESVLDFSREELERAHVNVVRELAPQLPTALADEGQLRQVFLNLLRNSREAMAGGGTLTVRSASKDGEVQVEFSDSGSGIEPEARARIFDPFFSTKDGGTGLGLALSRQILQAHGGSIALERPGERGTTFVIRLPQA